MMLQRRPPLVDLELHARHAKLATSSLLREPALACHVPLENSAMRQALLALDVLQIHILLSRQKESLHASAMLDTRVRMEDRAHNVQLGLLRIRQVGLPPSFVLHYSHDSLGTFSLVHFLANCMLLPKKPHLVFAVQQVTVALSDSGVPSTGSAACTPCSNGTWAFPSSIAAFESDVCNACPQFSSSSPQSIEITSCKCNPGYTGQDGAPCPQCPAGGYKDTSGSATCTGCSLGTWSNVSAAIALSTCTECHVHSTSNYYSGAQTECRCIAGYTGADGVECSPCAPGTWKSWVGGQACQKCKSGKYSGSSAAISEQDCRDCPAHTSSVAGASTIDECKANRGFYMSSSTSTYTSPFYSRPIECGIGTYKIEMKNNSVCTPCFDGSTTVTAAAISVSQCICDVGWTAGSDSGLECVKCTAGKYKATIGPMGCTDCPLYTSSSAGASACVCGLGYTGQGLQENNELDCTRCIAGKYKSVIGSSVCLNCPEGTYSVLTGLDSPLDCKCEKGYGRDLTSENCTECVAGKYKDVRGDGSCNDCPVGTYSAVTGLTTLESCLPCGIGKYSPSSGATHVSTCQYCPASKTTDDTGNSDCECDKGYFLGADGSSCEPCDVGTYSDFIGASACVNCPEGKYRDSGSSAVECTDCPTNFWSSERSTSPSDCWEIKFTTAIIGQTQPLAKGSNKLVVTLATNLDFPATSEITISGLTGATSKTVVSISWESQETLALSGRWTSGSLALKIASQDTLRASREYIFSFQVTNGASAQEAPPISIEASGRISTARMTMTTGNITSIGAVEHGSRPLYIFIPEFSRGSIFQTMPLAQGFNTFQVSFRATCDIVPGSKITVQGLVRSLTRSNSVPVVSSSSDAFRNAGRWTQESGSLVVDVSSTLAAGTDYSLSFSLQNPERAQEAIGVGISAEIETGLEDDAPMAVFNLIPKDDRILNVESGSKPFTIVVPTFTVAKIAQSFPVAGADTVLTVTFRANCDISAGSLLTVAGLVGMQTSAEPISLNVISPAPTQPNLQRPSNVNSSLAQASVGPFDSRPSWSSFNGHLVISAVSPLSTFSDNFVISFILRNGAEENSNPPNITLMGKVKTSSDRFPAPFGDKVMTSPGETIFGVKRGTDPLRTIVPAFVMRIVNVMQQMSKEANVVNVVTVTLGANFNLAGSDSSAIMIKGFTGMTSMTTVVALENFTINGTASEHIFSLSSGSSATSTIGYGVFQAEQITLTIERSKTFVPGLWYSFSFTLANPTNTQNVTNVTASNVTARRSKNADTPNITVEAVGTARFVPLKAASSMEEMLAILSGGKTGTVASPARMRRFSVVQPQIVMNSKMSQASAVCCHPSQPLTMLLTQRPQALQLVKMTRPSLRTTPITMTMTRSAPSSAQYLHCWLSSSLGFGCESGALKRRRRFPSGT